MEVLRGHSVFEQASLRSNGRISQGFLGNSKTKSKALD